MNGIFTSTYENYLLVCSGLGVLSTNGYIGIRLNQASDNSHITSGYVATETAYEGGAVGVQRSGGNWRVFDNKRAGYNDDNYRLTPNENSTESTSTHLDILSNGVKMRNTGTSYNGSGDTYIYMAFAENPFVTSTGIPTTAR